MVTEANRATNIWAHFFHNIFLSWLPGLFISKSFYIGKFLQVGEEANKRIIPEVYIFLIYVCSMFLSLPIAT